MFNAWSIFSNVLFATVLISVGDLVVRRRACLSDKDVSGSLTYLVDYERQRQAQSLSRVLAIDSLNRLYSTNFAPIVALRSVGLSFVNEFSPLKVNLSLYEGEDSTMASSRNSSPNKRRTVLELHLFVFE